MTDQAFEAQNELEKVLLAASQGELPVTVLLSALSRSELLVPVAGEPEGTDVSFTTLEVEDKRYVVVFTSPAQAQAAADHDGGFLRMTGSELAEVWPDGVDMVLNPGGEVGTVISEAEVRSQLIGSGSLHDYELAADTEIQIGQPEPEPATLLAPLRTLAGDIAEVTALYRAVIRPSDGSRPPALLVGVQAADPGADVDALMQRLAAGAGPGVFLQAIAEDDPVSSWMLEQTEPFFRR